MDAVSQTCPVCGYPELEGPPRSPVTGSGSFEICPACCFEFGVSDEDEGYTYAEWRQKWIGQGMPWASVGRAPPSDWDPRLDLARLLEREGS